MSSFSTPKGITRRLSICFGYGFVIALTILSILLPTTAHSAQVVVGWNASSSAGVTGYKVYYGLSSGNYTYPVADAGSALSYTIPTDMTAPTCYLTVCSYNATTMSSYAPELAIYYTTASAGTGGAISPSGSFYTAKGSSQAFTITPNSGYKVTGVTVDGASVGAVTSYTLSNVTAPHTVSATFASTASSTYTITASSCTNGSISPSPSATVNASASQIFTITPATGYKVASVTVDGTALSTPVTSYTFSNVTANHSIAATFAAIPITTSYTITASAGANGSISPSPSATVSSGGSQTFTITPKTGYKVASVTVDGTALSTPVTSYTFSNVTANHSISATFAIKTFLITTYSGVCGSISPSPSVTVNYGASQTITVTPMAGYKVDNVKIDGSNLASPVTTYTFSNVMANHSISVNYVLANRPVANAGPNQTVPEASLVTLSGSNSTDPANSPLTYMWTQTAGPQVTLSSQTAVKPTFTAPTVGTAGATLTFLLTVKDQSGFTATSTCFVNVTWCNIPPTAIAGPNQTVTGGTPVTLDGCNSTDPDNGIASYVWKQIAGSAVTLTPTTATKAMFVAPNVTTGTSLTFQLTVTDNGGLKASATCVVNVTAGNAPPVANAGANQSVYTGDTVVLNGTASSAVNGIKSGLWTQTSGPPVTLSNPTIAQPTFTAPSVSASGATLTFLLTITDNAGLQATASCNVYVSQKQGTDLTGTWQSLTYNGSTLSGSFTVQNTGTVYAGTFVTIFYLSSDGTTLGQPLGAPVYVTWLNPAASTTVTFQYSGTGLAGQRVIAYVDAYGSIAETNTSNNQISAVIP